MAGFLQAKQRVGGYEIDVLVGKGGMGEVYRARQMSMDRVVALKVLAGRLARSDPSFAKRFVDEARAAGRLNHPNIIAVHDVGKAMIPAPGGGEEEASYFSMEYVDGETLKTIVQRDGPASRELIERVMTAMSDALVYAEGMGVVHRDIKPDNIMVTEAGQVKLADLGLAQQMGETAEGVDGERDAQGRSRVMGTPMFMSPEQARGMPTDHRSDQYSLGATLFHLLTGRAPYVGADAKAIMRAHVFDPVPDPRDLVADVSEAWRKLCMKLMAKDPAQRFATAELMRTAVRAAIDGHSTGPGPSRRIRPQGKPVKYETRPHSDRIAAAAGAFVPPWVKATMALAVVAALVIVAMVISRLDGGRDPATGPVTHEPAPAEKPGDDGAARARAAIATLPADPEAAVSTIDSLIAAAKRGDDAYRQGLEREREERSRRLDEQRRPMREAQAARLAQAEQAITGDRFAPAREELAALADERPLLVAERLAEVRGKLDAAQRARVEALTATVAKAGAEADIAAAVASAEAAGLEPAALATVREAATRRRGELSKAVVEPARAKVDAKAVWREAMVEIAKLRGALPAHYDQFAAVSARMAAKAEGDPATVEQIRRLGDLSDLLEKAEKYLRIQLQSAKPRLNIKVGDKPQLMKVEDIDAENVFITTSSGRQPRPRASALDLEDELKRNLDGHPLDRRADDRRCYAAFIWYWKPDEAREALAALGAEDPLAKALAALEQNGRLLDVAAPVTRQGDALSVTYDFTRKDAALLADFEGEGAAYGENGLLWKSARAQPAPVEADLPTLRWRGRLRPPLTVSALAVVPTDTQLAMIGVLARDHGVRIGLTGRNFPRIECTALVGDDAGKLKVLPGDKVAFSFAAKLQLELAVAADGKTTLSVNGKPVAHDPVPLSTGVPLSVALQAYQPQDGKQSGIELLSLTILGRPPD